jgi:uncharacterized protein YcaQ
MVSPAQVDREAVVRLWLHRQGLVRPRVKRLGRAAFVDHLQRTGGLQLDSINVLDRAHYLTLWSRFGCYDRKRVDAWVFQDRVGYEYWGHEASVLPAGNLPLSRRRMRRWKPAGAWWAERWPSPASIRRVLGRLRKEGPLESVDFEDKRALQVLWHQGRVAVSSRRHFRRVYDLSERVYGEGSAASLAEYQDSWLLTALSGNGIASEQHITGYFTAPRPSAEERRRVIKRNLKQGTVVELAVDGIRGRCLALPEQLEQLDRLAAPEGTTLLSPFDSLLWQRTRAEELLGFHYRVEIYVPAAKRRFGYYAMPILHQGRLVGRLDPKLHRDQGRLEIKAIALEPGVGRDRDLDAGLADTLGDLARFVGAATIKLPRGWGRLLG